MLIKPVMKAFACAGVVIALLASNAAVAEEASNGWYVEAQYFVVDADVVDLDALGIAIGKEVLDYLAVEVVLGSGFNEEKFSQFGSVATAEIDNYYGLVVKPNIDVGRVNLFLDLGYIDISSNASVTGYGQYVSLSDSDSVFMFGAGADIDFTDKLYGSIGYIDIDEAGGLQVGIGYRF